MVTNKFIKCFLILLCCLINSLVFSQNKKVNNILFRTIGDTIEIFYDLPKNADTLNVIVFFRKKSDPKMKYRLKWAGGSIGIGKFSGRKQKVIWSYKQEPPYLFTGSGFYYEVIARNIWHRVGKKKV